MVIIQKGDKRKEVTKSSYGNYFKNSGWSIVGKVEPESVDDEWAGIDDSDVVNVDKPISEMNRQELEKKAISLGIDLNGLGSTKQLREAIRKAIN